jgi:hypothetical protein
MISQMSLQQCLSNAFKPLDMNRVQGYPHNILKNVEKWLPMFLGNNDAPHVDNLSLFYNSMELYAIC